MSDLLTEYSRETLRFRLGSEAQAAPSALPQPPDDIDALLGRVLRAWEREKRTNVVLFGLASGALAARLAQSLPQDVSLCVSEPDPALAQGLLAAGRLDWWDEDGSRVCLADTSPWAHKLLWLRQGLVPQTAFDIVNPELASELRDKALLLREAFHAGRLRAAVFGADRTAERPRVTLAAILRPDEPGLSRFFAQAPSWLARVAVLWDGAPPAGDFAPALPDGVRLIQAARPLGGDFAAQRNALLDLCGAGAAGVADGEDIQAALDRIMADKDAHDPWAIAAADRALAAADATEWILTLDGDELLPEALWQALPGLIARLTAEKAVAAAFPRLTLYPDADHAKCGYGLWPDLQLRLFRADGGGDGGKPRYERPVHERLTGLAGPVAVVLDGSILHESALRKSPEELEKKLQGFDAAGGGGVRHVLSGEYPSLPLAALPGAGPFSPPLRLLVLDKNPV
ncbi:family 2 glycosyl transferase [Desulfovibrio sp. X2]|uniref:family 2 glycosyl transferase n=1 Tax=Desulfovibrio sp. X2 TaxID=941449 RepID=UPI00035879E2|nr:family 2 glycosyl transferase [Desulfovibrio sp. X2]EPR44366.1 family 2 glycosyl transferase [Desulfovibrio sp. X2]